MIGSTHTTNKQLREQSRAGRRSSFLLMGGVLLCFLGLLAGSLPGCWTPVCRADSDCKAPTTFCILAQCRECGEDTDCPQDKRCDAASGTCRSTSSESSDESVRPDASPLDESTADTIEPVDLAPVCTSGATRTCYSGPPNTVTKGICKQGKQSCVQGQWSDCTGEQTPRKEVCDGQDHNCNGQIDEGCPCKSCKSDTECVDENGQGRCKTGACYWACATLDTCNKGFVCRGEGEDEGLCLPPTIKDRGKVLLLWSCAQYLRHGSACNATEECGASTSDTGMVCLKGVCRLRCQTAAHCPAGSTSCSGRDRLCMPN